MATKRNGSRSAARNAPRSATRRVRTGAARHHTARTGSRTRGSTRKRRTARKVSVGYLFWTALMLMVLVVFLLNRAAIRDVMERTELVDVLQRNMDSAIGREQPSPMPPARPVADPQPSRDLDRTAPAPPARTHPVPAVPRTRPVPQALPSSDAAPGRAPAIATPRQAPTAALPDRRQEGAGGTARQAPAAAGPDSDRPAAAPADPPARQHRLYFAAMDSSGGISVTGVTRTADPSAAPLTETVATLLAGPDPTESNRGLVTLIPPTVTLNKVYIRGSVAYIDVSESFRFNRLGREGLDIQLQQVVYSATQFASVEQVQILIDGERIDYLDSEGTFVGKPIGREAFQ